MKTKDPKKKADIVYSHDVRVLLESLKNGRFGSITNLEALVDQTRLAKTLFYISGLLSSQIIGSEDERSLNLDAQSLIEAIAYDKQHQIWRHIDGLKADRTGPRSATTIALLDRALILAFVQILREDGSTRPMHDAVAFLEDDFDLELTVDKIRGWSKEVDHRFSAMIAEQVKIIGAQSEKDGRSREETARIWIEVRQRQRMSNSPVSRPGT